MTQGEMVIKYIRDFGSISSFQAYAYLGITQLGARIYYLKRAGYQFVTDRIKTTNRYGKTTHYDVYRLVGEPNG